MSVKMETPIKNAAEFKPYKSGITKYWGELCEFAKNKHGDWIIIRPRYFPGAVVIIIQALMATAPFVAALIYWGLNGNCFSFFAH